jgi:hypothetical protein
MSHLWLGGDGRDGADAQARPSRRTLTADAFFRAIAFYRSFGFEIDFAAELDRVVPTWIMRLLPGGR